MTERKTNLSSQIEGTKRCHVCIGCGRCAAAIPDMDVVVSAIKDAECYESANIGREKLLIAADIGTTTVAMQLRRVSDGEVLGTFRAVNSQRKYGADVVSRIQAASVSPKAAEEMRKLIRETLEEGVKGLRAEWAAKAETTKNTDADEADITAIVIAANTTMVYLLMGYPVESLGRAPFHAEHLEEIQTELAGIPMMIMPGISAFVGADVAAGLYTRRMDFLHMGARKIYQPEEVNLFLDLGTNGEMVLGNGQRVLATATAAGPAFEGRLGVGVWGADVIKCLAVLLQTGLMDETGLLADEYFDEGVRIGGMTVTQADIRCLQLAKAAVYAGICILCDKYGLEDMAQIKHVYLAGGMGYYLDTAAASVIGLFPKELNGKVMAVGNTALEGAFCYGRDRLLQKGDLLSQFCKKAEVFHLADEAGFQKQYIGAINFEIV